MARLVDTHRATLDGAGHPYVTGGVIGRVVVIGGSVVVVVGGATVVVVVGGCVVVVGGATVVVVVGGCVVVVVGGATVVVVVGGSVVVVVVTGGSTGGGGGKVPGNGGNDVGNVVVVEPVPTPTGMIPTLAGLGWRVDGRLVLKPNGDSTDANRPWSCWVTVPAGAGGAPAPAGAVSVDDELDWLLAVVLRGRVTTAALTSGPLALAVEPELPGRKKATNDTTAKTRPATSMVASICSSLERARSDFRFGTRPIASTLP
jgi:hypothetical protein